VVRDSEAGLVGHDAAPSWLSRPGDRLARGLAAFGLGRWARPVAVLLSVLLLLSEDSLAAQGEVVLPLVAYVLATSFVRRDRYLRSADLLVSVALIVVTGPVIVGFLPFLLVTVAGPATRGGSAAGLAAGFTLTIVLLVRLLATGELRIAGILPLTVLLPVAGLMTAAAAQLLDDRTVRDRLVLQQANRLLNSLQELADDLPGGLDIATVGAAIVAELRNIPGAAAGAVLVEEHGLLRPTASTGLAHGALRPIPSQQVRPLLADGSVLTPDRHLPSELRVAFRSHPHWRALALGQPAVPGGVLLVGFDRLDLARDARGALQRLAEDGGLALDNARLFDGTQVRAADAARRRIAGELHDGAAQSLAHLRMELELMARTETAEPEELGRLARVAEGALEQLRATIAGLRATASSDLGSLLEQHLEDLRSARGPVLELRREGVPLLDPGRADEVLRVAQEALSNALRHARASRIEVSLRAEADRLELSVTDDGVGLDEESDHAGGGVGLSSMRERATRLGGELRVSPGVTEGTRVLLSLPIDPVLPDRSPS
jgi:signal transduction histidine kinase